MRLLVAALMSGLPADALSDMATSLRSGTASATPAIAREGHPASRIERHSLRLQPDALLQFEARYRAQADGTGGIHHTVPRQRALTVQRMKGVAHLARVARESSQLGDLTVGGDATARNAPHHAVDLLVA